MTKPDMSEIILINVSGRDRPGITAALTDILAQYGIQVLDIGQSVIHEELVLGLLMAVPPDSEAAGLFKHLLFKAHELGLSMRFTPVSEKDYEEWVLEQGQPRHIITLLAREITAKHLSRVSEITTRNGLNIDHITRLTGRRSLRQSLDAPRRSSVELSVRGVAPDMIALHGEMLQITQELDVDVSIQEDNAWRRNRRLVCFDMDSTLIQTEVIDELAAAAGVKSQVSAITEAAMGGEIDFNESFRRRMALLAGLDESALQNIAARLPITEGAERLISTLKRFGYRIAILSGGFTYFAEHLQRKLDIDYVYANQLDIENGKLTGRVKGDIVDGAKKAELLRKLAVDHHLRLEQVIAVGDGANDLPMLSIAGLGIAFHAKPIVKEQARHSIANLGLDAILYLLGMRDTDIPH
jgi:phosphoserine phosphatase